MLRNFTITTGTVLAITTLTGLVAIDQAVTLHHRDASVTAQGQTVVTNEAADSAVDAGNAPLSPVQFAVLLEGFDWQVLPAAAQAIYAHKS